MKNIISACTLLILCGCATQNLAGTFDDNMDRKYEPIDSKIMGFDSKDLTIKAFPNTMDAKTHFEFINKSKNPISIDWNNSSFVGANGNAAKIFHGETLIKDRSQSLPPTMIPPGATVTDDVVSVDSAEWSNVLHKWTFAPVCGSVSFFNHMIDDAACVGKTFTYFFMLDMNGKKMPASIKFQYVSKTAKAKEQKQALN